MSSCVLAAPTIDSLPSAIIPAGKSLTVPVTATSPNGRPLTFTAGSTTNRIAVQVRTNNQFWKISVAQAASPGAPGAYEMSFRGGIQMVTNMGEMTFMLFRDTAPHAVDVFQGLTAAGLYTSNTIFHRVIAGFMNQGGDPLTNGTGGPVVRYEDEFHPQQMFTGKGQLALANSGKDTDGSQFFVTVAPYRYGDFGYTIFGQLLRGFNVLSNINNTLVDTNNRPLADVIITKASLVPDYYDTVLTLTAANLAGVAGTIRVVADDGAGGRTTNAFSASTVADANVPAAFLYPSTVTNLVGPANKTLTNMVSGYAFPGVVNNWYVIFADTASGDAATNSSYDVVTNQLRLKVTPNTNYTGPVNVTCYVSADPGFSTYDKQTYTFGFGDTAIQASAVNFTAGALVPFSDQVVATFTNGAANSSPTNFSALINWGDNSTNSGTITTDGLGRKEVRGSHTYTNPGDYPVYVSIRSALGAGATAVCTSTVPPALSLSRSGTKNTLSWPAWALAYQAQSNTNFMGPNWVTVTNAAYLAGYENVVTNATSASALFFRVKK